VTFQRTLQKSCCHIQISWSVYCSGQFQFLMVRDRSELKLNRPSNLFYENDRNRDLHGQIRVQHNLTTGANLFTGHSYTYIRQGKRIMCPTSELSIHATRLNQKNNSRSAGLVFGSKIVSGQHDQEINTSRNERADETMFNFPIGAVVHRNLCVVKEEEFEPECSTGTEATRSSFTCASEEAPTASSSSAPTRRPSMDKSIYPSYDESLTAPSFAAGSQEVDTISQLLNTCLGYKGILTVLGVAVDPSTHRLQDSDWYLLPAVLGTPVLMTSDSEQRNV